MRVSIRLFAVCRDRAGQSTIDLEFDKDSATMEELKAALTAASPALAPLLPVTRVAVNQEFALSDTVIRAGDEVALIPPVSGGSGQGPFEIRTSEITLAEVERAVHHGGAGAVVSFAGNVRDKTGEHEVEALEYEAYDEMAQRYLAKIGGEVADRWPGARVAILHRKGRLIVGETSVVIAVSSPHRAEAFEGCRHAIEQLKKDVPIWKREIRADGSVWVGVGS